MKSWWNKPSMSNCPDKMVPHRRLHSVVNIWAACLLKSFPLIISPSLLTGQKNKASNEIIVVGYGCKNPPLVSPPFPSPPPQPNRKTMERKEQIKTNAAQIRPSFFFFLVYCRMRFLILRRWVENGGKKKTGSLQLESPVPQHNICKV